MLDEFKLVILRCSMCICAHVRVCVYFAARRMLFGIFFLGIDLVPRNVMHNRRVCLELVCSFISYHVLYHVLYVVSEVNPLCKLFVCFG
jgi:hypothetical protein